MTLRRSDDFHRQYKHLPAHIQKKVDRQLIRIIQDIRHPGARAKKMSGRDDVWEVRVDYHYRLTFQILDDILFLRQVGPHDILRR